MPSASRTDFYPLTVARVEPLTDDSAAVTFTVPPPLADRFTFAMAAGGHPLPIRCRADGHTATVGTPPTTKRDFFK